MRMIGRMTCSDDVWMVELMVVWCGQCAIWTDESIAELYTFSHLGPATWISFRFSVSPVSEVDCSSSLVRMWRSTSYFRRLKALRRPPVSPVRRSTSTRPTSSEFSTWPRMFLSESVASCCSSDFLDAAEPVVTSSGCWELWATLLSFYVNCKLYTFRDCLPHCRVCQQ